MRRRSLTLWGVLSAWTVAGALAPAARAEVGVFPVPMVGEYLSYFNLPWWEPGVGVMPDHTIRSQLLAYIRGAQPGSEIRGHITYIDYEDNTAIVDALKAANLRGVAVYLVQYSGEASPQGDLLEDYFGTRHKYCYEDVPGQPKEKDLYSCVSSIPGATHHIKNWMFSHTHVGGIHKTYSSLVTSYNLTDSNDHEFNDLLIVNDNQQLYEAYVESFKYFYGQRRRDDLYNIPGVGYQYINNARTAISYSPHTRSAAGDSEYSRATDHVAMALSRIDEYEHGCSLRVVMYSIGTDRGYVLDEVKRIKQLGCRVQVIYSKTRGGADVVLLEGGVDVRRAYAPRVHSKVMMYTGHYNGWSGQKLVWGGSHNWGLVELRQNDEVFVQLSHPGIFEHYNQYFDAIWDD